ncbi:hydrogenase maturation protein [Paenibacillus flagellatus]|uniref:Hydrogenase maturation protein n=1 Tax=Paenibacillus flagellatus TaxID=2211139 RepID=A0A2V5K0B1_9BACL|nr:hydrogenase maturation protein [Paenibacillus flagellatus]PYI52609.1 hydrogenase maturation protein [Paenibacillus flagellatus]
MNILFLSTSHNSMSQRLYVELTERGHDVTVHTVTTDQAMLEEIERVQPELIVAPFMKTLIPESIWTSYTCLVVHPGIKGDRGPNSLDWAIMENRSEWGVTVLQATAEMDAGDIWASARFPMRPVSKSQLYRREVTNTAVRCVLQALDSMADPSFRPEPLDYARPDVEGRLQPKLTQRERKIDWNGSTEQIARTIRAADSHPGVLDELYGEAFYLFGAHEEDRLKGTPGELLAVRDGAICRATGDGAIWITHLKPKGGFKLPAALALKDKLTSVPELPLSPFEPCEGRTFRDIYYEEADRIGYLHFPFYNGAMSTDQCERLRRAVAEIKNRPPKVLVLMGGEDFWSNGIHLNVIEHAESPADESWANIQAMDDLVKEILLADEFLTVSAMQGNAGAGGVILALAGDYVYAREGIVLNPHYKKMGGLYGSEYWTYLLPKRVGRERALQLTEQCLPVGTAAAKRMGLIDDAFGETGDAFGRTVSQLARELARRPDYDRLLADKRASRERDERTKPLQQYRDEELARMWDNFYGSDKSYHAARRHFVYKISCISDTPAPMVSVSR